MSSRPLAPPSPHHRPFLFPHVDQLEPLQLVSLLNSLVSIVWGEKKDQLASTFLLDTVAQKQSKTKKTPKQWRCKSFTSELQHQPNGYISHSRARVWLALALSLTMRGSCHTTTTSLSALERNINPIQQSFWLSRN